MSSKIIIPIAVVISVIVTAGIMYSIGFDQQPQVSQIPIPEIIYVDKSVSEYFEGTHDIKKISQLKYPGEEKAKEKRVTIDVTLNST